MTRFKSMFVFVAGVVAVTGCSSLPEYAAPKFRDEYNAEMADFIPYRKLERADFKAEQPPTEFSEHAELMAAVICVFIKPVIDQDAIDIKLSNPPNEEQVYRITYRNLRYRALMDRNCSWWNSKTVANDESYILEHEQIHFALAELGARRGHESTSIQIDVKLGSPEAMAESVQKQLKKYLKQLHESVMAQDREFDEETSLVHDPYKQKQWWNLVQAQLSATASVGTLPDTGLNEAAPEESEQLAKYGGYAGVLKLLRPLAEQGHIKAQYALGWMYRTGKGVTQDYEAAVKWYQRAAEQGYAKAQASLGSMYYEGLGVTPNKDKAFKWFKLAAEQGDTDAQTNLALLYLNLHGTTQDYVSAAKWFHLAAENGNSRAQQYLGVMYFEGRGVTQNYKAAFKWFKLSADQGEAYSQNALGYMYENGLWVEQNYDLALEWYRRTVENGSLDGQANLGWMYHTGRGVEKDNIRAFMWLSNAVSEGLASYELKLEQVQEEMTDADIYKSQELLNSCRAKAFKEC